jgi:glycosyltransferase involved in cell wall biosynthesis
VKVLLLHNRYKFIGGEETVVRAEQDLLKNQGHQVDLWEISNDGIVGLLGKAKAAIDSIYSSSSKQKTSDAIARLNPDIVHVHNFFPLLSPSVYDACDLAKIPVVHTLHNYRLGCPNAMLFRQGKSCEDCLGHKLPWQGVVHGCYRDSRAESAAVAAMLAFHWWRGTWQNRVNAYIVLTAFQKEKMIMAGLPEDKIYIKPNYVCEPIVGARQCLAPTSSEYALFVGRISIEKGITTLIDAYLQHNLRIPLKIAGNGPLLPELKAKVQAAGLEQAIEFLGHQDKSAVWQLMQNARFLVFPSIWYETFGLTMVEAFACGLPVVASRLGSMAEIVEDGVTGLHFEVGNAKDLAEKMQWAYDRPEVMQQMGNNARGVYENYYTPQDNYRQLMDIYQAAKDMT